MKTLLLTFAMLVTLASAACSQPKPETVAPGRHVGTKEFDLEGTMKHTDLEGGCWYLEAATPKGVLKKYEIIGDPQQLAILHHDERWVRLVVEAAPGHASTCMLGEMVKVLVVVDTIRHPVDIGWTRVKAKGWFGKTKSGCWYLRTTTGLRLELQQNVLKQQRHVGRGFAGVIKYIPGLNVNCKLDGILIDAEPAASNIVPRRRFERK